MEILIQPRMTIWLIFFQQKSQINWDHDTESNENKISKNTKYSTFPSWETKGKHN